MASVAAPTLRTSASPREASGARMRLQATGSLRRRPARVFTAAVTGWASTASTRALRDRILDRRGGDTDHEPGLGIDAPPTKAPTARWRSFRPSEAPSPVVSNAVTPV